MGVSGCTSCQTGGMEALKAYDHQYQMKLQEDYVRQTQVAPERLTQGENNPVTGAISGSVINLSV
ncbi:hypothetical protein [Iodobacter fluviatilis]|uniref:Uncharacterized protein n=1 Tax=Iodobacter fluviatilis TaxID=537 RepID=A0A377Q6U5_9NEIS|nr:hypothetical protein [Iodobacter fluviatilis]TCU90534.1 hypothetical protein EV682_101568 [Iodobacter fluviatilis]STQ89561.1 Uncharacterised protein [Iodobacter fluviatilis]